MSPYIQSWLATSDFILFSWILKVFWGFSDLLNLQSHVCNVFSTWLLKHDESINNIKCDFLLYWGDASCFGGVSGLRQAHKKRGGGEIINSK